MHSASFRLKLSAFVAISCISLVSASVALSERRFIGNRATVSLYSSTTSGVLDPFWDSEGPSSLERQLKLLKFNVASCTGEAGADPIQPSTRAFVIPPITGDNLYSDIENVKALHAFVNGGGLVVLHESVRRPQAAQDLIAQILGYEGAWQHCETITDNSRHSLGLVTTSSFARDFIDVAWPRQLEDARAIQVHSWCKHEDPAAVSYPLFTLGGDPMKTVAQAFARVGTPGAVLWLGYSWQSGPQDGWGALLGTAITAFQQSAYTAPSDAALMEQYPLRLDAVVDSDALAIDTVDIVRRFLTGSLVSTAAGYGNGGNGYYGYYGYYPPSYSPFPSYPSPPSPQPPPLPSPLPPPLPTPQTPPPETRKRFIWFRNMTAHGVQGVTRPVVWYDDADFNTQKFLQYNNSKLWLVDRQAYPQCNLDSPCRSCRRAWYPYNGSNVPGFPNNTVVLYFREPVILKRVIMTELLQSKAVAEVFLLGWPAVPIPELGVNITLTYSSVNQTTDVFRNLSRRSMGSCAARVDAYVKPPRGDDPVRLPPPFGRYNQTNLPSFFASRAVGGVGIVLKSPIGNQRAGQISRVHFVGRVLYPQDPNEYGPYLSPRRP